MRLAADGGRTRPWEDGSLRPPTAAHSPLSGALTDRTGGSGAPPRRSRFGYVADDPTEGSEERGHSETRNRGRGGAACGERVEHGCERKASSEKAAGE
ncbi:hypothetical protein AAFF_G00352510 [Aldrovandia affinis]|uniref:Uncharacterized protein n=1 Tax=Aldrovandia affinis TaxID=143900 RepID=A0AAD7SJ35_9TELE|nr:hypothetical protein AAFF_G00352510 [Aldrovandia affinis]